MTATIVHLLPVAEYALLKCFVERTAEPEDFEAVYAALEIPKNPKPSRLSVAIAQIILHHIQGTLPQCASVGTTVRLHRKEHRRQKDARLSFNPQLVCTINWADSAPGISWPEAYHVTYLPGFDKFVITASRDGPDAWGCADHAIGVADGNLDPVEAAKEVIIEFWRSQVNTWDQCRWAYLLNHGLIEEKIANVWADEVWHSPEKEQPVEEEDADESNYLPKIPMLPSELPQQRIYGIVELPERPTKFECLVGYNSVPKDALPKAAPRSAVYLGQVEWAWSPMHGRLDAYYLKVHKTHWVLWSRYWDDNWKKWEWVAIGCVARKGVTERVAAVHLLLAYWEWATMNDDLDEFHHINEHGFLSVSDLRAIARRVWDTHESAAS